MTTIQIEYFLTAARLLSFTAAAECLYMTQPNLSRQIASMENELGFPLFVRKRNSVTLTPAGKMLYERLAGVYGDFQQAVEDARDIDSGRVGHVVIGLMEDQIISDRLIDALGKLIEEFPDTQIDISRLDHLSLFSGLMNGSIDFAQMLVYDMNMIGMSTLPLSTDRVHLALAKKHISGSVKECTMEQLQALLGGLPLVMTALDAFPEPMQNALSKLPPVTMPSTFPALKLVNSISVIPLYVTAGLGATLVNKGNLLSIDPKVKFISITDGPTMTDGIVWRNENSNPIVKGLVTYFQS